MPKFTHEVLLAPPTYLPEPFHIVHALPDIAMDAHSSVYQPIIYPSIICSPIHHPSFIHPSIHPSIATYLSINSSICTLIYPPLDHPHIH
jgi:hypothetical protein